MRKKIISVTLAALLISVMPMTVFAHGHGNKVKTATAVTYALCTAKNCNIVENHKHNGTTYAGHHIGDGHEYHQLCTVKNCTKTGAHNHNGITCLPHSDDDGHSYHNVNHKNGRHH